MKKDAHEFAHLIRAFKGAAEYMWTNFDHVTLNAIYSECIAIDEEINREVNAKANTVNLGDFSSKGASFSNLEDCPISEEEQRKFDEMLRKAQEKTTQSLQK